MKISFKRPLVPNFVETDAGWFPLYKLSEEELSEFAAKWCERLKQRRQEQIRVKEAQTDD